MSVKIRPWEGKEKTYEYDIEIKMPDGSEYRERRKCPVLGHSAAKRWAVERERFLVDQALKGELGKPEKVIPTMEEFWPRFEKGVLEAKRSQPGTLRVKNSMFRNHIHPKFGSKRVDEIGSEDVAVFSVDLASMKSGDKVLLLLHQMLRAAFEWGLSPRMPTFIWPPKSTPKKKMFPPEFFEDLLAKAKGDSPEAFAAILLLGEMGLRTGELQGLCWVQIDWRTGRLTIDRQIANNIAKLPKGEKTRVFKPTPRTMMALRAIRHLRGDYVFADEKGNPWDECKVSRLVRRLYKSLGCLQTMGPHALRHCAIQRMSLAGVPLDVIRQITGHANFDILQEYLHDDVEATGMISSKLADLDFGFGTGPEAGEGSCGEILETGSETRCAEVRNLATERRRRV